MSVSPGPGRPGSARFDAVLFDCDGVLVDSEPISNEVLQTMLGELGWDLSPEEFGLLDAFGPQLYSGMETPRSKPAPDVYLAAAAGLGVDPSRCAVVEDTVVGTIAGVAAGAIVYGYSPGGPAHSTPNALRAVGASEVFTAMEALPDLLISAGR